MGKCELAPVEEKGVVTVVSQDGRAAAFDLGDGEPVWQVPASSLTEPIALTVDEGELVVAMANGQVAGLDPQTGSEHWSARVTGGPLAGTLTAQGLLLAFDGAVAALQAGPLAELITREGSPLLRIQREPDYVTVGQVRVPVRRP